MRFLCLVLILLLQMASTITLPAGAQDMVADLPTDAGDRSAEKLSAASSADLELQIRTLDREILLELLKLAEFNVRYQQCVNHCARWRNIVYPLAQEAGYAGFLGYTLTDVSQRGRGWNSPAVISPRSGKRALASATVGSLLGGTSSLLELTANGAESIRAKKQGFSQADSIAFLQSAVTKVDSMLDRRNKMMTEVNVTGTRRELLELKEQLLKYERDRLVFEFKRWSSHARGFGWYRNTFYIVNIAVNAGRFSAIQLGFKSFTQKKCVGATGIIQIATAFVAGLGPVSSSAVGTWVERHQRHLLDRKLPAPPFISDQEAKQKFERLAQLLTSDETREQHGQLSAELVRLREEKVGLDTLIFHEERNIQRLRKVAGQQSRIVPFLSALGASSGICSTVGYHAYRQQPLISNRLGIAGDAAVIPAEAVALIATPAAAIAAYMYERNLRNKGEHPQQLLSKRLKDLKTLETLMTEISH
jgi:hypothetical protein